MQKIVVHKEAPAALVMTAFVCLYIIWGSTYLGIRIGLESIPPFFLVAARFLVAGAILFAYCLLKGEKAPSVKTFATIGFGGVLMLFLGNGAVSFSEQYLPSGLAAIIVATVPLWFILLDKRQWKYHFSNKTIVMGILVGFAGVMLLFAGKRSAGLSGSVMNLVSFFILIAGTVGWAVGSLYSKYKKVEASVTMKASVQMLAAGIVSVLAGLIGGEHKQMAAGHLSWQSASALIYLVIFGSLIGYMSYIWLLTVRPAAVVGTYAYVNPVVAVFLGWLIAGEQITLQQVMALAVILAGVILVNLAPRSKKITVVKGAKIAVD